VRLDMADYLAHLALFDWASMAKQDLVSPASLFIDHAALREAHVIKAKA